VTLAVSLTSSSAALRERAHVCFAYNGTNRGVSVYLPDDLTQFDVLAFDIHLLFPRKSQTLTYVDLITYLPMFKQSFGHIGPNIRMEDLNVAGAGLDITCDTTLQAEKIAVSNSFASITGSFNATQSIKLDNINGAITSNVTLYNDPSTKMATYLAVDTGNSDINLDVTMVGPAKSQIKPMFNINVQTFNGSLSANVGHDSKTSPAALQLYVNNNQAPTHVQLDSKFMGMFYLHSKIAPVSINPQPVVAHPKDPTGAGRSWTVALDAYTTSSIRGWTGYGVRPKMSDPTMGSVSVGSSLSPIVLEIVP